MCLENEDCELKQFSFILFSSYKRLFIRQWKMYLNFFFFENHKE